MSVRWQAVLDRISVFVFVVVWAVMAVRVGSGIVIHDGWLPATLGLLVGYLLSDLLAGSAHWMADRYFDPETPILGPMLIAPFREHHNDALEITRHDFFEVSGNNALITIPVVVLVASLPTSSGFLGQFVSVLGASATLALFLTNQFHSWAHAPSPPRLIRPLHRMGLILTPEQHARHHCGSHDRAYCVTSGWLNPLLDQTRFFERLGRVIAARPGRNRPAT